MRLYLKWIGMHQYYLDDTFNQGGLIMWHFNEFLETNPRKADIVILLDIILSEKPYRAVGNPEHWSAVFPMQDKFDFAFIVSFTSDEDTNL